METDRSETAATAPSALMDGAAKECPSRFQIIMASDIVYDEAHTALIWRTVAALLSHDKHAMFVSTASRRILRFLFFRFDCDVTYISIKERTTMLS